DYGRHAQGAQDKRTAFVTGYLLIRWPRVIVGCCTTGQSQYPGNCSKVNQPRLSRRAPLNPVLPSIPTIVGGCVSTLSSGMPVANAPDQSKHEANNAYNPANGV